MVPEGTGASLAPVHKLEETMAMKKLTLNKETLKVLSPSDTRKVQGGLPKQWSELANCSEGNPCTSGCTTGSVNCLPNTVISGC